MGKIKSYIKLSLRSMADLFSNNLYLLKIVWNYNKLYFILFCLLTVADGFFPLVSMYFPKMVIDAIQKGKGLITVFYIVTFFISISLTYNIISLLIRGHFLQIKSDMLYNHFSIMLKKKAATLDIEYLENPDTYNVLEKATKICQGGATKIINALFNTVSQSITIISILVVVSKLNYLIVLLALIVVIINSLLSSNSKKVEVKTFDEMAPFRRQLNYYTNLYQDYKYAKDIRLFNLVPWLEKRLYMYLNELEKRMKPFYVKMHKNNLVSTIVSLFQDAVCYLVLGYQVIAKMITFGDFVLYFNAISRFTESLNGIMWGYIEVKTTGEYIKYFRQFLSYENKIQKENKLLPVKFEKTNDFTIKFENVVFSYPGSEKTLFKDLNLTIKSNKKYAIVGPNGAGKTSLVKLLTRLYDPQKGAITLNGVNIKDMDYVNYRNLFSVVFQDYQTYSFSIKENVTLSDENAADDDVYNVLKNVGLAEKVQSLSKGIYTQVDKLFDSNGIILSGGEAQKLAIARAFYKNAPIIILDEPSSALDPYAEHELFKQLAMLAEGKTALFISHRLSSVKFADYVIFIKEGNIVACAPHEQLMRECSEYNEMYALQANYYIDEKAV